MKNSILLVCLLVSFFSCSNGKTQLTYSHWQHKEIVFPTNSDYYIKSDKIKNNAFVGEKFNVLAYIDSVGCLSCNMMLSSWRSFIDSVRIFSGNMVGIEFYVFPRNPKDFVYELVTEDFPYPVCIDLADSLNKLNHFPSDSRFHCFLLDENNRVVLIGNPVQNPKIKDLYIRTICERLNIDYKAEKQSNPRIHLGIFQKTKPKRFCLKSKIQTKKFWR